MIGLDHILRKGLIFEMHAYKGCIKPIHAAIDILWFYFY